MLGKIQASLNLSFKDTDSIVSKSTAGEDLKHRIERELEKASIFKRAILHILGFFRNRSLVDVLIEEKLYDAKETLRTGLPGLIQTTKEVFLPEFAQKIYDVYAEAAPLKPIFDHLYQQKLTFEAGLLHLIETEHPNSLHRLIEIFPLDEMEQLFKQGRRKASLYAEMRTRLDNYFVNFPKDAIDRTKEKLKPLYFFKPLVNYPYAFLFDQFGHNSSKQDIKKYPYFTEGQSRKVADYLERFYYGIYLAQKIEWKEGSLNYLFQGALEKISDGKKIPTITIEEVNQHLESLQQLALKIGRDWPWKELLQWSFHDPYYTVKFYLPSFSIRDFYQTTLEIRFSEEMEKTLPHVRQRLYEKEKSFLFPALTDSFLDYYRLAVPQGNSAYQMKSFQFTETMSLMMGFLTIHFLRKILPFLQSLSKMINQGNKAFLQSALACCDELVNLREKLIRFDKSLHPESEDGKDFLKFRYEISNKPTSQRPLMQLIQKKDAEAKELFPLIQEQLQILQTQMEGFTQKNIPVFKSILKLPYLLDGKQESTGAVLETLVQVIEKGNLVLQEAYALES